MSEIRFIDVSKSYPGSVEVIRNLNLEVNEGEFMVLVGPSGCAKSTTLRMIAGLEDVTKGDLLIGGKRANNLTPGERNISMVFQSYALFPNMTVRENLSFGCASRYWRKRISLMTAAPPAYCKYDSILLLGAVGKGCIEGRAGVGSC